MNKNGFTLAELLGVIVILALISLITVPAISGVLGKYKTKLCYTQIDQIVAAARVWGSDNILRLPNEDGEEISVSLKTLSDYGYIDKKIDNPTTKTDFSEDTKVYIKKTGKKYVYTIDYKAKEGLSDPCQ